MGLPLNFLTPDNFLEILQQHAPTMSAISVAFPLQHSWQSLEELVTCNKSSLFLADPPLPTVALTDMSFWHCKAIDLVITGKEQILYIYGKAGTGKTEVALHICEHFKGKVQAGAGTGDRKSVV